MGRYLYPEEILTIETLQMAGKKRQNRSKRNNGKDFTVPPATTALSYRGPVPSRTSERGITAILREVTTQATGSMQSVLNVNADNNPSSSDNWSDYAAAWTQYRVLAMRFQWQCVDAISTSNSSEVRDYQNCIHTIVHQTAAPSTASLADCFSSGDSRITHLTKPFVRTWKMLDATESKWMPTSSPAATSYAFSMVANGLTSNNTYGYLYITYYCQFRTSNT